MRSRAFLALTAFILLSGCSSPKDGGLSDGESYSDLAVYLPASGILPTSLKPMNPDGNKVWFDAYGMTETPGKANTTGFSTQSSLVPDDAYGAIYANNGSNDEPFVVFALRYSSEAEAQQYLNEHNECKNDTSARHFLKQGDVIVLIVAGTELQNPGPVLGPAAEAAEDDIAERTGAEPVC